ncbi:hypothetical protein QEJ31_11005 [Pigmentibacter sp. JX0631]|uniref:hypothetical protein n=1 Tax=Pigmentibacter sp. JX0631 TaxID=2976982 RepID=UPI0024684217|nr:hypothetical protein [Pigmentibacter sp. JX0631]WGL59047.1 hypothetical protein QEJ31_11005 [Pigmentibacter sp. JX0631]
MPKQRKQMPHQSSVRWDEDLHPLVEEWFEKNPGWTISQLANQAIRKFVLSPYTTNPVELVSINSEEGLNLADKAIIEHADALERLK